MVPRRQAGDETDQSGASSVAIRAPKASSQPVRAVDRNHSQRQGGQAQRIGKMVKLQEAENQIVIDYEVYAQRRAIRTC